MHQQARRLLPTPWACIPGTAVRRRCSRTQPLVGAALPWPARDAYSRQLASPHQHVDTHCSSNNTIPVVLTTYRRYCCDDRAGLHGRAEHGRRRRRDVAVGMVLVIGPEGDDLDDAGAGDAPALPHRRRQPPSPAARGRQQLLPTGHPVLGSRSRCHCRSCDYDHYRYDDPAAPAASADATAVQLLQQQHPAAQP
jgi:hypothetical protein